MTKQKGTAQPAPGEDNNKRLAFLEAGASSLAKALVGCGVTLEANDESLFDQAVIVIVDYPAVHKAAFEDVLTLRAALTANGAEPDDGANIIMAAIAQIKGGAAAIARAEAAEKQLLDAEKELEELRGDVLDLEGKIAKLEDAKDAPDPAPEPRARPEQARDIGPAFGSVDREKLEELLGNGEGGFEIAFSNGEFEIVAIEPVPIKVADLRAMPFGRGLDTPLHVRGGEDREEIHGAALLYEGEQVAYCAFPRPVEMERGQERRFDRSIIFG